jgi:cobyrinic acid a,c-diamide synthase
MYLSDGVELRDGRRVALCGLLPAWTRMLPKRRALGYAEVELSADTLHGPAGTRLKGHEFHYSELSSEPAGWDHVYRVAYRRGETAVEGFRQGNILASYVHLHLASHPKALDAWVEALCAP